MTVGVIRSALFKNMGAYMKTTIEISDAVLEQARRVADAEGTTLRALVEQGLRHELARRQSKAKPFRLRDASFGGKGLQSDLQGADWEQIRDLAYQGRA